MASVNIIYNPDRTAVDAIFAKPARTKMWKIVVAALKRLALTSSSKLSKTTRSPAP
jgi:hypothetical protein